MSLPSVPDSFFWTEESWGVALRCRPLERVAPHLFSTRQLALSGPEDWERVSISLCTKQVVTTIQVHGRAVAAVNGTSDPSSPRSEADALVSDRTDVAIAVRVADCVPLLMADSASGAVAAVHAGWRGTAAGVVGAAVEAMTFEFGTRPSDVIAAIGPSIGVCCYEVGSELVDAFAAAGHSRDLVSRWFVAERPFDHAQGRLLDASQGRRWRASAHGGSLHLDLPTANRDQLILAGVPEESIHSSGLCTAMHVDLLTSYRVEKEGAGRLVAAITAARSG